MTNPVAFIFAHPDDETFLCSAFIRGLADEGNRPLLLLATRGDAGNKNGSYLAASREELSAVREREMEQAAALLGLHAVTHLGYPDGLLDTVDEAECVERIAAFLNQHQCPVVVTFPENGGNGHRDHIAISKLVTMAVTSGKCPSVQRLYYVSPSAPDREEQSPVLRLDTKPIWDMKAAALRSHASQILAIHRYFGDLHECPELRRYEGLRLVWERGQDQLRSALLWLTEGLGE